MGMDWGEEQIARLRAFWAVGYTTTEIARHLGCSKNAVVGKAHRLNLPARPSPIRRDRPPRKVKPPRAGRTTIPALPSVWVGPAAAVAPVAVVAPVAGVLPQQRLAPPAAAPAPAAREHRMRPVTPAPLIPPPMPPAAPPSAPVAADARPARLAYVRPPRQCEFIVQLAVRRTDPPLLCEKAADGGRSYCAEHARICYAKAPPVRVEAQPRLSRPDLLRWPL